MQNFLFIIICSVLMSMSYGLCEKVNTYTCPDKIGWYCCGKDCACITNGWRNGFKYTPGGCPKDKLRSCSNATSSFNSCTYCGGLNELICDVNDDTGTCV